MTARLKVGSGLHRARRNRSRGPRHPFAVFYFWTVKGQRHEAHTVENGSDLADAEARFQRRTPWVTVFRPSTGGAT